MIEFRPHGGRDDRIAKGFFFIWGLGGLVLTIYATWTGSNITVITTALLWIGGVLFFGIAALISDISYRLTGPSLPVYVVNPPRADGLNSEYRGIPYAKLENGQVIAEFEDGKHTFKNWKKFIEAVGE